MKRLDTIYHRAEKALKRPQVRRRIKWGAVLLLCINILGWSFGSYFAVKPQETRALSASQGDGILFYSAASNTTPQWRTYSNSANDFSANSGTVAGAQPAINQVKTSPTKQEAIAGYQDTSGNLRVLCYDGTSWTQDWTIAVAAAGTPTTRRFDIAYETNTGDVMVAYSRNTAAANALAYRTKPGSASCGTANWTAAANFPTTTTVTSATVLWVRAARDGRSAQNLNAWVWLDNAATNADLGAAIWSGSAFTNFKSLETSMEHQAAVGDSDNFDVQYESLSGDVMVVWGNSAGASGVNGYRYNTCTGGTSSCTWLGSAATMPTTLDEVMTIDLSADSLTDKMAMAGVGGVSFDMSAGYWSGSAWTGYANVDTTCETTVSVGSKKVTTGWLTNNGNTKWYISYDDASGTGIGYKYAINNGAITSPADFTSTPALTDLRGRYDTDMNPFNNAELIQTISDDTNGIFAYKLTMDSAGNLSWGNMSSASSLGTKPSHPQQGFAFTYWRYVPPNSPPTLSVSQPDGVGDTVTVGQSYDVTYDLDDTDNVVTAAFYYDTDTNNGNGYTAITGPCATVSEGVGATCAWDTTGMTPGSYYVYGITNDGVNPQVSDYSPGQITIQSGNSNPDIPTNLGPAGYIDASGWMNDNTPTFNFDITDPDASEQVKYQIQIDDTSGFGSLVVEYQPSSYGAEGTYNYTVGQAGSYAIGSPGMTLSDAAGYYWRVKAIDDDLAESAYEEAGADGTIDFRLDATAPTSLTVYDGTVVGVDQDNSGTALNSLAANWTAANFNVAGPATPNKYQYAIGTTAGGTNILGWTSTNTDGAVVTANSLNINTSTTYYWTVRATDLAGNVATVSSNGQMVLPTLSFSIDTSTVTFADLGNGTNWTDTKQTNITTQTNAQGGYSVQAYILQLLTNIVNGSYTVPQWSGTYASPAAWAGNCPNNSQCGFGYTSSDANITTGSRGNMYNSGANYCAYTTSASGDVVADNAGPTIDGSRNLVNEIFTLTHRVSVSQNQASGKYQTTLMLLVTSNY